jgi:dTDP-glucose 4,6-dehydratase
MLDFALAVGAKRFVLTSSGGVYGPQPYGMERIPEGYHGMPDSLRPANAYSVAKRAAEHLCALYQDKHGLECVIARCFAFVGTDLPLNIHFAIGNFIRDALYRDSITVAGDGTAVRSYLDQRDLAHWLLTLLDKGQSGRAYNVGSDQAITIANLADQVSELLSPGKPVYILGKAAFSGARSRYVPDISRARVELGLDVTIPLGEAIRVTAEASQL